MAPLINQGRLADKRKSRQERRERLLVAARAALLELPLGRVTLDGIGQRAGLGAGAATLFFPTREELVLELLGLELASWACDLERRLGEAGSQPEIAALVELLVATLAERPLLVRLLGLLPALVELDPDILAFVRLERARFRQLLRLGPLLEQRWPHLIPGAGAVLLRRFHLLVAALAPVTNPVGMTALALGDEELAVLRCEHETELRCLVRSLVEASPDAGDGPT